MHYQTHTPIPPIDADAPQNIETATFALGELLKPLRDEEGGKAYVTELLQAALRTAGVAGGIEDTGDLVQVLVQAAETKLVMKAAAAFRADLQEFGPTVLPVPS